MVEMNSLIQVGSIVFRNKVESVEIDMSRKNLVQTASFRVPRYIQLLQDAQYKINVGDKVTISLGYDGQLREEFSGYIAERISSTPLEFKCEDEMWPNKQKIITENWKSITLKNLLRFLIPDATLGDIPGVTLSPFRLDRVSVVKALEKVKEEYGLDIYFRGNVLYAGLAYNETGLGQCILNFQKNLPKENTDLEFKNKEDIRFNVQACSILPNNKRIKVSVGDSNGDTLTLHFYNIKSESELRKLANEKMERLRYDGYKGSIKSFGVPYTTHGMVAVIVDERHPERNSSIFIDGVKIRYNSKGYRRINELGRKAQG